MKGILGGLLTAMWLAAATTVAAEPGSKPASVPLIVQTRGPDGACLRQQVTVDPAKTAVVVIDMWDRHWCTTYTARVGNLVPRMNQTLDAARKLGIQVVFAPSDVVAFWTLQQFVRDSLAKDFPCTVLAATAPEGTGRDDIPQLAAMDDADLLVLSMRRRSLPVVQMDHLERYLRAGKPLVALRTSVVAFQTRKDPQPGYVVWDRFDQEVLGCNYQVSDAKSRAAGGDVWIVAEAAGHPVLAGVAPKFHSPGLLYRQRPLAESVRLLLSGRGSPTAPAEPVAWTNTYRGGRVFYTTLGHPGDFETEAFRRLLLNAIHWALGRK